MIKKQFEIMYQLEESHWWFLAKQTYIEKIIQPSSNKLTILDIGCGTGGTSKFLEKWGNVTRLEPSVHAASYLKKRNLSFLPYSIEEYTGKPESFDAIFILDVLYHKNIQNDKKVLQKVYSLVKPGGFVCITDCANPYLISNHDQQMHARTRYTKKELIAKTETAGFIISRASYIYCFVFPLFIVQRVIDKFVSLSTVKNVPIIINKLLTLVCLFGAEILKKYDLPFGSSVIIVGKKLP